MALPSTAQAEASIDTMSAAESCCHSAQHVLGARLRHPAACTHTTDVHPLSWVLSFAHMVLRVRSTSPKHREENSRPRAAQFCRASVYTRWWRARARVEVERALMPR
eukprot:TRINITY_DN723_c0_g1_i5.p2 TRINITY_DN723_c0_g1~~TRINITY_DN723_c0_g1_i5.p2  ORF type:complete len:107 (+),score=9.44 TRINITY_DN723_c0_g1_i5:824-1144(+)